MTSVKLPKHYRIMYLGCSDIFSRKLKMQVCSFALQQHLSTATAITSCLCVPCMHAQEGVQVTSSERSHGAVGHRTEHTYVHAHVCAHMYMRAGGGACFLMEFANRFRLTKSDHTSIWKLYFLTWAIFWKIDSDVWNWFRTVVRNAQYKWKKLVFNVFSSQLFLLSKYAFWGARELVGGVRRGRIQWSRLFS